MCSLCKQKTYCSLACKLSDMIEHRKACSEKTMQEHVYAFCGSFPEQARVSFLKTLPSLENSLVNNKPSVLVRGAAAVKSSAVSMAPASLRDDLTRITEHLALLPESFYFRELPSALTFPKYFVIIRDPVSLRQIQISAKRNRYTSVSLFLADLDRMVRNAELFNGTMSFVADQARFLLAEATAKARELECGVCGAARPSKGWPALKCQTCHAFRCASCPKCPCLLAGHKAKRLRAFQHLEALTSKSASVQERLMCMTEDESSVLAQMLADERPDLFDKENVSEVNLELTPSILERIESLFI